MTLGSLIKTLCKEYDIKFYDLNEELSKIKELVKNLTGRVKDDVVKIKLVEVSKNMMVKASSGFTMSTKSIIRLETTDPAPSNDPITQPTVPTSLEAEWAKPNIYLSSSSSSSSSKYIH